MITVFIIFAAVCLLLPALLPAVLADERSASFNVMTSPSGAALCAVDEPDDIEWLLSTIACGIKCLVAAWCKAYNFNTLSGQCDKYYHHTPTQYSVQTGCTGFVIRDSYSGPDCSFPYTYNGNVYFSCTAGINGLSVGCLKVNRTAAACSSQDSVFTARTTQTSVVVAGQPSVPALSVFGWIVMMQRTGFGFNWNLPWSNYKNGFGSAVSDFWLGLERVHLLTSSTRFRLRVEVQWQGNGTWSSVEYWSFTVGDEATSKYRLNVDGFSGDTNDGLRTGPSTDVHSGMSFSTADNDNDKWSGNCALDRKCGWWFNACFMSCLTCEIPSNGDMWSIVAVQSSRMMLKPQ